VQHLLQQQAASSAQFQQQLQEVRDAAAAELARGKQVGLCCWGVVTAARRGTRMRAADW
jgi:hypothetical protein